MCHLRAAQVGYKAVDDYVKSGMVVGLGTGSTAAFAVERVREGHRKGTSRLPRLGTSQHASAHVVRRWDSCSRRGS